MLPTHQAHEPRRDLRSLTASIAERCGCRAEPADARDEDLDGPAGYESVAQRKREFAADMGIQAHALRMAAVGAVAAYEQVVGETWKPFDRPVENPGQTLDRKVAAVQLSAFE